MTVDRTMYKITMISLGMICISKVIAFVSWAYLVGSAVTPNSLEAAQLANILHSSIVLNVLDKLGMILFFVCLTFWASKFIKQQFPEVA